MKRAFLERSNCVVEFNSTQRIITFRDYRPQTPNVNLTLPKTLNVSLKRNNKLTIHADGSVEPTTIYIVSQLTQRLYTYTVQNIGGGYLRLKRSGFLLLDNMLGFFLICRFRH